MRDRLIELLDKKISIVELVDSDEVWAIKKIAELADHLLAEGVIVPPCKVGQTVYIIGWDYDIEEFTVKDVAYLEDEFGEYYYRYRAVMRKQSDIHFTDNYIGNSVFLTREEAEKALEGRENDNY